MELWNRVQVIVADWRYPLKEAQQGLLVNWLGEKRENQEIHFFLTLIARPFIEMGKTGLERDEAWALEVRVTFWTH